jgi:hypothetical protein
MALVLKDRVKTTTTTTGTGTVTLGSAAAGYQSFNAISPTSAAWDVSKASYSEDSFSVAAQDTSPSGVFFKPDGTKMYISGGAGQDINEYDLSSAWDVSTASYLQNFSVSAQDTSPQDLFFKTDGTKMYFLGLTNDSVYEYDLSSAWNISTASFLQSFSVTAQETSPQGLFFKPDGTKMYVIGITGDDVNEYNLSTAWDISTSSYLQTFSVTAQEDQPRFVFFKSDGTKFYVGGPGNNTIYEYDLSSAWDVSSASYSQRSFSVALQASNILGFFFKPDGTQFWVSDSAVDSVVSYYVGANNTYYVISGGSDWEVGVGTVLSGTNLLRTQVFESSNSDALVNFAAGTKDVIVGYPSTATAGGVPNCDNSSIGTDLSGWSAFQAALQSGVTGGTLFGNNSTNGIVSTYSLVYTVSSGFIGGVLAPNGDIHFVPRNANKGQKISATGVVSTYSLVYTVAGAYEGGVLASNGDIYFVPYSAVRGQKISASGVVSTYSLVYTVAGAYTGGVLAPNGDIHFVPRDAVRGQKVSVAGVVSTYSLVYTAAQAYEGGVLAPNGDIHFVPYNANIGQKISAASVVSTYSLVYTAASAYEGGVLSPNGDIHFVPYEAAVGQKISAAGVVSTYSLVYTASSAYAGGVLAPNGDIHFVPYSANRGQKISASGVVSTYSLAFTTTVAYAGGVLTPNGDIYFIPVSAVRGQTISTNPGQPLGLGVCLSSFLNKF